MSGDAAVSEGQSSIRTYTQAALRYTAHSTAGRSPCYALFFALSPTARGGQSSVTIPCIWLTIPNICLTGGELLPLGAGAWMEAQESPAAASYLPSQPLMDTDTVDCAIALDDQLEPHGGPASSMSARGATAAVTHPAADLAAVAPEDTESPRGSGAERCCSCCSPLWLCTCYHWGQCLCQLSFDLPPAPILPVTAVTAAGLLLAPGKFFFQDSAGKVSIPLHGNLYKLHPSSDHLWA